MGLLNPGGPIAQSQRNRCSIPPVEVISLGGVRKDGRPFEISPIGSITINYTPSQYRIKYFPGHNGKPVESDLNCHLKVGNDPENLLRIYFLHDDRKQLIVIGSRPHHLRAVSIK